MSVKRHQLGDIVYHRVDPMQEPGIITGILERPGHYIYIVAFGYNSPEKECYDIELNSDKNVCL